MRKRHLTMPTGSIRERALLLLRRREMKTRRNPPPIHPAAIKTTEGGGAIKMTESRTAIVIIRSTTMKEIGGIMMIVTIRDLAKKKTRGMLTKTERGRKGGIDNVESDKNRKKSRKNRVRENTVIAIAMMIADVMMIAIVVAIREANKEERMTK
eukprot:907594-Ditylum_brightwellii.AAC.1